VNERGQVAVITMFSTFGDRFAEQQARLVGISEVVSKSENAAVLIHKARGLLYPTAALYFFPIGKSQAIPF
jgi:hypothetical protein